MGGISGVGVLCSNDSGVVRPFPFFLPRPSGGRTQLFRGGSSFSLGNVSPNPPKKSLTRGAEWVRVAPSGGHTDEFSAPTEAVRERSPGACDHGREDGQLPCSWAGMTIPWIRRTG